MAMMAADPATQRWWAVMEPMQKQIEGTPAGLWWMPMEEMYHFDGPKAE
jgi:L-rhamnose mutarotase